MYQKQLMAGIQVASESCIYDHSTIRHYVFVGIHCESSGVAQSRRQFLPVIERQTPPIFHISL